MAYNGDLFEVEVFGARAILDNLSHMPDTVRALLADKVREYAALIQEAAIDNVDARLSKTLSTKEKIYSGSISRLRDGILVDENIDSDHVEAYVYVSTDIPYARIQEDGGHIGPHMIFPREAKVLAFYGATGEKVMVRRVFHPGATLTGQHYLRDAYRQYAPKIGKDIQKAVVEGIRQNMRNQ